MVDYLIKLLGAGVARRIERGSLVGAAAGAFLGGATGVFVAYHAGQQDSIETDWRAVAVTLGVIGGFLGGFLGSLVRLRPPTRAPWERKINDTTTVRLTNFNAGLAPLFIFILFIVLMVAIGYSYARQGGDPIADAKKEPLALLIFPVALGAGVVASLSILWVDVGAKVRVRKLLTAKEYPLASIRKWYFQVEDGRLVQDAPKTPAHLVLVLPNGRNLTVPVTPEKAIDALAVLKHPAAKETRR